MGNKLEDRLEYILSQQSSGVQQRSGSKYWVALVFMFLLIIASAGGQFYFFNQELQKGMMQMRKIYTYDLQQTLRGVRLDDINREFEAKINILNDEVESAKKKISSLREGKDKDNFSEVYLKSLKLKRDTMVREYGRTIENITMEINKTITQIAIEKNALVVLDKRVVASQTENVEDLTDEVVKRINFQRPRVLDE